MSDADILILITCLTCGEEHYFDPRSMPGGDEHCEYCDVCFTEFPKERER